MLIYINYIIYKVRVVWLSERFGCDIFRKMKKTFEAFEALGGLECLKRLKRLLKFPYCKRGASRK